MTAITRVDDTGVGFCNDHNTNVIVIFLTGSSNVLINNKQAGMTNITTGIASCGHPTLATTGSSTVFINNNPVHRISDTGTVDGGTYTVNTGSPNVFAG